jgi:hypothetical protein
VRVLEKEREVESWSLSPQKSAQAIVEDNTWVFTFLEKQSYRSNKRPIPSTHRAPVGAERLPIVFA